MVCPLISAISSLEFAISMRKKKNIHSPLKLGSSYQLQLNLALYIPVNQSRTWLVFNTMMAACCKKKMIIYFFGEFFFNAKWQFSGVL